MDKNLKKEQEIEEEVKRRLEGEQVKRSNKQLKMIVSILGILFLTVVVVFYVSYSAKNFEYKGLEFREVMEGKVTFFTTSFPLYSATGNHIADYNVYLRNNPRDLKDVPFEGELVLQRDMVLDFEQEFNCDGDGIIATANMVNVLSKGMKLNVFKNESLGCDPNGNYVYVRLQEGDKTEIVQTGYSCYEMRVNNCEILDVTERFLIESLSQVQTKN